MAKIVLTLLDGKVLTRDNKVIGSESGCCCCFCSETCERCIITDAEFYGITPPLYQMLDKTPYAPAPDFCAEVTIAISHTTSEWASGTNQDGTLFSSYSLNKVGEYAEEVEEDGTLLYKTKMVVNNNKTWAQEVTYVNLPDNNLYVAEVPPTGEEDLTRRNLYLFCLKGDGTDGPFAKIGTFYQLPGEEKVEGPIPPEVPKKIFNIDIDLHKCGWVFVIQHASCGQQVDADSSCSMNFARIPSDDTGCPEIGNYNTVATFLSPTEIAAKDPHIECPDDHEDILEDENENSIQDEDEEVAVVCEFDEKRDPGVTDLADCDERTARLHELMNTLEPPSKAYWNTTPTWPRTQGITIIQSLTTEEWVSNQNSNLFPSPKYYEERTLDEDGEPDGGRKYKTGTIIRPGQQVPQCFTTWAEAAYVDELPIIPTAEGACAATYQWGARCIPYKIWVRKTLRKTTVSPYGIGTTLCCIPDAPGFYYYFIKDGSWGTLSNWIVASDFDSSQNSDPLVSSDPDLPGYIFGGQYGNSKTPTILPGPFDRVVILANVTTVPANTKVLSMEVAGIIKVSVAGTISTTEFSIFRNGSELTGKLLGTGKIIFRDDSIVSSVGIIGDATNTSDFTLVKFKHRAINNGNIYHRFCNPAGSTNVPQSVLRFVEFHGTSYNASVGIVNYTPAKFYDSSTNKGIICKDFGKGVSTNMNTLVENEGYPRSFFYDQSTNIAGATVVGTASFYNLAQNLGTINNAIDPYADKSINSAKFYGLVIMDNFGGPHSENGPTGEILGYADFYDNATNYGDVVKDLTLHDHSSCGYKAGNDEDSINVGGDLIMRNKSGLGGAKIKIVGSLTTGTLGSLTENPTIFTSNIEVANNTNLYSQTQVRDSQILCTTDNKTMTINDTSFIFSPFEITEKTTIKYAIVIFNDNADNSAKIIPYSSPNTTTFNDSSINRSEDIVGVLTFNDDSRNVVESDLVATYISVTFNDDSANMKNLFAFDPELCSPSFDSELCSPSSSSSSSP